MAGDSNTECIVSDIGLVTVASYCSYIAIMILISRQVSNQKTNIQLQWMHRAFHNAALHIIWHLINELWLSGGGMKLPEIGSRKYHDK